MARRKRKGLTMLRGSLALWAGVIAILIAVTAWHVIGWLAATALLVTVAYVVGRKRGLSAAPARKLSANSQYGKTGVREIGEGSSRTRRNGWTPPTRSQLLSRECASGECVWCHDKGCQHDCGHPSQQPAIRKPIPDQPEY